MSWTAIKPRSRSSAWPVLKVTAITCRVCKRQVGVLEGDPLPPGWVPVMPGGRRDWASFGGVKCEYMCDACARRRNDEQGAR